VGRLVDSLLHRFGYEIHRNTTAVRKSAFVAERLRLLGNPRTVIDVGAAGGTPVLYEAFPSATIVLVDPIIDRHREAVERIRARYREVVVVGHALGEAPAELVLHVESSHLEKTSLLQRTELTRESAGTETAVVRVERLDDTVRSLGVEPPFGLKIDTEGYELQVLKGATALLPDVEFVISEVSVSKRFEDSYTFEQMIALMDDQGFHMTDVLDIHRPDPVGTRFVDLVFMPKA
jgi:FkbM family methyltransferase